MECKNCHNPLKKDAQFCDNCGGKVVENRITLKFLIVQLAIDIFGVDSRFFITLRKMFTKPEEVLGEYLSGVRKRYVNPFAYLAIGAALCLITFNFYADDFIIIQEEATSGQMKEIKETAEMDLSLLKDVSEEELKKLQKQKSAAAMQLKFQEMWLNFFLRYFNLMAFLFLPIYALYSKWTFRKPYNFGEHIVINAYLQGSTMYISLIAFFLAILINPKIYTFSIFVFMLYYLYSFSRLYQYNWKQIILSVLRFILVGIIISIILMIVLVLIGTLVGIVLAFTNPELIKSLSQ